MTLDYQQVRKKVAELGQRASLHEQVLYQLREKACGLFESYAEQQEELRKKVQSVVQNYDPSLRCALPVQEALNLHRPAPPIPTGVTLLAVDGSQINPDRHAQVQFCLINWGAVQMRSGDPAPLTSSVDCRLYYEDNLYTKTEAELALERDLGERDLLAQLAAGAPRPVITLTDGPLELWGAKDARGGEDENFTKSLNRYLEILSELCLQGATTAGYVDKPGADLVVRTLEVAITPPEELPNIRTLHPLRGVTDAYLFQRLLAPGERSAVFAMQSQSARKYTNERALHFFYLNVGRPGHTWIARVEIPRWVAESELLLSNLHAALVYQCRILGARPYPYLLHRAHETAVVTQAEKEQVTQMIVLELRRRRVEVGEASYKQLAKDLQGRTRL
jgi:hypothetical protein